MPLRVGHRCLSVADEAGSKGRPVFLAGCGGKAEDRAAERAGLVGQRGPNFSAQDICLDLPPDRRLRAAARSKERRRANVVFGKLFEVITHLEGQAFENGAVEISGRGVHCKAVDRAARAGQHIRRAAHALQKW